MDYSRNLLGKMALARWLSSVTAIWLLVVASAHAHEIIPAIADLSEKDGVLIIDVRLSVEGIVAGIDLSAVSDTNEAPQAADYDQLRSLAPPALAERFQAFWPEMASNLVIETEMKALSPKLLSIEVSEIGDIELVRSSRIRIQADLPPESRSVRVGWAAMYGALVIRQMGVEKPYDAYLENGQLTDFIALSGGSQRGPWETFLRYISVGFDHILPKGLDHVLFVLGLFFLSTRLRPLIWQVSAFTIAHTVTLAASALGYVSIPANIVEPIIALSIVYVAVENIFSDRLTSWRPLIVFGFGLLHGLGFASVLGEFGLPDATFVSALIGFNVGVELGQLAVIAIAFAIIGYWFGAKNWYRSRISVPGSVLIGLVGGYWFLERTIL